MGNISIKQQIVESIEVFIKNYRGSGKEYVHLRNIEYTVNGITNYIGTNQGEYRTYREKIAIQHMFDNYNYVSGALYGLHGNSRVFEIGRKQLAIQRFKLLEDAAKK